MLHKRVYNSLKCNPVFNSDFCYMALLDKSKIFALKSLILIVAICMIFIFLSCCKTNTTIAKNCGCDTDSDTYYVSYNNFRGYQYNAWLLYVTKHNQNAWFISVEIPNTSYGAICKICNPDLPIIRAFTDTSSRNIGIPIKFSGEVKKLCPGENWGFVTLPETLLTYITIDSLKK